MKPNNLTDVVNILLGIINPLLLVLIMLSFLFFLRGLASFIFKSGDVKNNQEGKSIMIRGLVGLFVLVSIYGILKLLSVTFGWNITGIPLLPGGLK